MNIETQNIAISKIVANTGQLADKGLPKNPRLIKDERFDALKKSIERSPEFLKVRELIVYPFGDKFIVIGGNQRLKAAKELKLKMLPCKVLDIDTPIEKLRELTLMDNNSFGENDNEILLSDWDLQELADWDVLPTWEGVDSEEGELNNALNSEAKEDDYIEPVDLVCDVKSGDLVTFEKNGKELHRLLCGDSTKLEDVERVMNREQADICFTSPPYNLGKNVSLSTRGVSNNAYDSYNDNLNKSEYIDFLSKFTKMAIRFCRVIFVNIQMLAGNKVSVIEYMGIFKAHFADIIIWSKSNPQPAMAKKVMNSAFEFIFIFSSQENPNRSIQTANFHGTFSNVINGTVNGENKVGSHKAAMPVLIPSKIIQNFSESQNTVYEPFCGTGTTMVAAHQLNRRCYGLELSEKYCQVIIDRMTKLDSTLVVKINNEIYAPSVPF